MTTLPPQPLGRPRAALDLGRALRLLRVGASLHSVAWQLGVPRSTLRRRLEEHGLWGDGGFLSRGVE